MARATSKGSYRSWKKIIKVWIMMMEGILVGHPFLALPPLTYAWFALASLALGLHALTLLGFAPLYSPLPC